MTQDDDSPLSGRTVCIDVEASELDAPLGSFEVAFVDGELKYLGRSATTAPTILRKRIARGHLEEVIDRAEEFVRSPESFNLDWLRPKLHLGIE